MALLLWVGVSCVNLTLISPLSGQMALVSGMRECLAHPERAAEEGMTADQMEELFLALR